MQVSWHLGIVESKICTVLGWLICKWLQGEIVDILLTTHRCQTTCYETRESYLIVTGILPMKEPGSCKCVTLTMNFQTTLARAIRLEAFSILFHFSWMSDFGFAFAFRNRKNQLFWSGSCLCLSFPTGSQQQTATGYPTGQRPLNSQFVSLRSYERVNWNLDFGF